MRFCFIFIFLLVACKESTLKLEGSHNSPATAFELAVDKTLTGEFNGPEDIVFIRVHLAEALMLRAELSAARGVDSSLSVFNPPDKLLFTVDDRGSSLAEEIPPIYLPAGLSLIRIRGAGGDHAAFSFFYRTFKAPSDIESEPNNSNETATPITGMRATGFYGPEFDRASAVREREKDCFVKEIADSGKNTLNVKLTGVDGVLSSISLRDATGKEILRQEASAKGSPLEVASLSPKGNKIFICVAAVSVSEKHSRDYYDLTLSFVEATQKTEIEPNNSAQLASVIAEDQMSGAIATFTDTDFFSYTNRREYPISLRIDLESGVSEQLALMVQKQGYSSQIFENSAPKTEVAENIRLDAGERINVAVKNRAKLKKKNFKAASYTLKLQETQVSDENETEPNASAEKADSLVDLTQKWGFINPVGDVDYYRLKLSTAAERKVAFESKIDCKVRLEHVRGGKTISVETALQSIQFRAMFEKDDLIKVQCIGQKPNPAERAYRIALTEP